MQSIAGGEGIAADQPTRFPGATLFAPPDPVNNLGELSSRAQRGIWSLSNVQGAEGQIVQGLSKGIAVSSKCATLRVARVACRGSAIPAIIVSRRSPGRPLLCRSEEHTS